MNEQAVLLLSYILKVAFLLSLVSAIFVLWRAYRARRAAKASKNSEDRTSVRRRLLLDD